ncbi:S-layer protein [Lysinibacillus sphaericus]|uniref:S-layer homology domain-containing protein n=1 Tax=Lysinibacillus sphaericus TaxID=1421 RepID=UPI0018CE14B1|nr:S-layer homology domain-containing protein [Lysinibacillus sphaericus]MBG9456720.1 S-layer protein [Lysinibacillus sphaericus]MBG9476883.1 S-layer protein [Lysinibacillus sphaericus]MBG9591432.1 S-layer protein [Lysinibacillus sphaericus]
MEKMLKVVCSLLLAVWLIPIESVHAASFKDVSKDNTLITEIDYLVEKGIINGYPNNLFKPDTNVTRAQVAVMLTRALRLQTTNVKDPKYQDVPTTHPYYKEIAAVQNAGIFNAAQKFNPNATLSRGNMAIVLQRAFKIKGFETSDFTDVSEKTSGYKEISIIYNNNIARGYDDGSFRPNLPLTRAHFSAFLARALTLSNPNLLKDTAYDYTYAHYSLEDKKQYTLNYQYSHNDGKSDVWTVSDLNSNKVFNSELLFSDGFVFGQGVDRDYDLFYDLFFGLPLRIGVIQHEDDGGIIGGIRLTVKATDGTVQAGGVNYNHVIVLEEMSIYRDGVSTYYFVDGIGLVKELYNDVVVYELLDRTAK